MTSMIVEAKQMLASQMNRIVLGALLVITCGQSSQSHSKSFSDHSNRALNASPGMAGEKRVEARYDAAEKYVNSGRFADRRGAGQMWHYYILTRWLP